MMMKEIKIVTAFFDIGRGEYETHKRSTDTYFEYFKFWARIKNDLIVYCDPENVECIKEIREGFGLAEQTTIIPVNMKEIEPDILARMLRIESDEGFQNFRYLENDPSNTALYNYVMLLKAWCMADAARTHKECNIAWIDFGFNHGGARYIRSEEFDFLWEYPYPEKINAFCLSDPIENATSLIAKLQFQTDCFTGNYVVPSGLCELFWEYMREAMCSLLDIGCMDDDQYLITMVWHKHPELFHIQIATWFDIFLINSNQIFTLQEQSVPSLPVRVINKIKRTIQKLHLKKSVFIKKMIERERQIYG